MCERTRRCKTLVQPVPLKDAAIRDLRIGWFCGPSLRAIRIPIPLGREDLRGLGGPEGHGRAMKVRNSLKSLRARHRENRVVRRRGRVYVINKTQRRFKARQG